MEQSVSTSAQTDEVSVELVDTRIPEDVTVAEDEDVSPPSRVASILGFVKSPIGMGATGVLVIGVVAATVLSSGLLGSSNQAGSVETDGVTAAVISDDAEPASAADSYDDTEGAELIAPDGASPEQDKEPPAPAYGDVTFAASGAMYHTAPTTVALQIGGEPAQLTLSLGILVDKAGAEALMAQGLTVNILKIEAAQSVNYGPYLEWELPGLISKELQSRLEVSFPDTKIRGVLIRDFKLAT